MSKKWLLFLALAAAAAAVPAYALFCDPSCPVCPTGSCPLPCP